MLQEKTQNCLSQSWWALARYNALQQSEGQDPSYLTRMITKIFKKKQVMDTIFNTIVRQYDKSTKGNHAIDELEALGIANYTGQLSIPQVYNS